MSSGLDASSTGGGGGGRHGEEVSGVIGDYLIIYFFLIRHDH